MAKVWMDIEQVRQQGQQLNQRAGQLEQLKNNINQLVQHLDWEGPDAKQFKNDWWPQHQQNLQNCIEQIKGLSQSAINNAQQQEETSRA